MGLIKFVVVLICQISCLKLKYDKYMIGVSGGRQSLYTSRPWGLKPLTLLHKLVWKVSERRKNPWLEPAASNLQPSD